jgi:hypothetical protein
MLESFDSLLVGRRGGAARLAQIREPPEGL